MVSSGPNLYVQVFDDQIIETLPRSRYSVTYDIPQTLVQLLAWRLVNDKARELGLVQRAHAAWAKVCLCFHQSAAPWTRQEATCGLGC